MIEPGAEFLARSPVALSAGSPRHTAWLRPTACRPRSMTTCLFRAGPEQTFSLPEASPPAGRGEHAPHGQRAGPEQTFSLPEASPPAGRVQHAQYGQSAAIVIDAIDHDVVGAHHDFTGLQREDGPAASRTEGAGGDAAGATTGGAGPRSPKSLAGLLVALVRLVTGIAGTCFQRQKGVVSENGK